MFGTLANLSKSLLPFPSNRRSFLAPPSVPRALPPVGDAMGVVWLDKRVSHLSSVLPGPAVERGFAPRCRRRGYHAWCIVGQLSSGLVLLLVDVSNSSLLDGNLNAMPCGKLMEEESLTRCPPSVLYDRRPYRRSDPRSVYFLFWLSLLCGPSLCLHCHSKSVARKID